jgi:hypothetical protein
MNALSLIKAGWASYSTVKDAVQVVAHPVQWMKDQLIAGVAKTLLRAFTAAFGPQIAQAALEQLNVVDKAFPLTFDLTVPRKVSGLLSEPDSLETFSAVVNEVLGGPLEALGYRIGRMDLAYETESRKLSVGLQLGLLSAKTAAPDKHLEVTNSPSETTRQLP